MNFATETMTHRVTGNGLITLARDFADAPKSTMVLAAGYQRPNGKPAFVDFYEALLGAQGKLPSQQPVTFDAEDPDQDWCELIAEFLPDVDLIDARDTIAQELEDLGIETEEQLQDRFEGCFDTWDFYREFGEQFLDNCCERIPEILLGCIDWEALWNSTLRFDYNTFEFGGCTYVFRSC